jgi:hypothetical protein
MLLTGRPRYAWAAFMPVESDVVVIHWAIDMTLTRWSDPGVRLAFDRLRVDEEVNEPSQSGNGFRTRELRGSTDSATSVAKSAHPDGFEPGALTASCFATY